MNPAATIRSLRPHRAAGLRRIGIAVAAGAMLAVLGPFGSYLNPDPVRRFAYWIGAVLLGLILYGGVLRAISGSVPVDRRRYWPALAGGVLLASVPQAAATRAAALWLWPGLAVVGPGWSLWYLQTATIGLLATAAVALVGRRPAPATPAPAAAAPQLGGDVIALQMEDHYVRVHRAAGSELVLMPLARAIDQVAARGLRTHRSWWVAARAVAAVEGDARSMRVRLSNGVVAPVARSAVARVKAAGWLDAG